jgi:glycosyltransferase involved in cell wall biosynthesis
LERRNRKEFVKKILHVIDSLARGGAERLVIDTINSLNEYEHHLIILHDPESLRTDLEVPVSFLNLHQSSNQQIFSSAQKVRRYIQSNGIDLVHAHLYFSSVVARLATPRKVPLFNSLHIISSLDNYTKNKLSLYLERITYRKRHHIIAVSREVLNDFDKWIGVKGVATVLYNFINDNYFQNPKQTINTHPFRLVAIGNLRYQKNYPYLIQVFKHLPANVTLDIYGEGPLREELQRQIDKYRLAIQLMGTEKELYKKLPVYDAFIMSSFFEGQPLSLLEAIASGLPVILADIPVLREVTAEHAVYFDLNDPMDLVKKIKAILDKKLIITNHTKPALERISQFAKKEIYMNKLRGLYNSTLTKTN